MNCKCLTSAIVILTAMAAMKSLATTYQYDSHHRLNGVTFDDGARITYEYDASGNRTGRTYLPPVLGDLDGDRDVDLDDFGLFAIALSGHGVTTPPPGCEPKHFTRADLDQDGDVDLGDFAVFQAAFGAN